MESSPLAYSRNKVDLFSQERRPWEITAVAVYRIKRERVLAEAGKWKLQSSRFSPGWSLYVAAGCVHNWGIVWSPALLLLSSNPQRAAPFWGSPGIAVSPAVSVCQLFGYPIVGARRNAANLMPCCLTSPDNEDLYESKKVSFYNFFMRSNFFNNQSLFSM